MKTAMTCMFLTFWLLTGAQSDLPTALGKGDVAGISSHLGDKVELTIAGKEEILAKSVVQTRLKDFFSAHPARSFKMMHAGNSKANDSNYQIGELVTDQGSYRVYLYYAQQNGARVVTELRIEQ